MVALIGVLGSKEHQDTFDAKQGNIKPANKWRIFCAQSMYMYMYEYIFFECGVQCALSS